MPAMTSKHPDAQTIADLGGPAELARKLGFDPAKGGVQRVQNWTVRGIPPLLKYERPDVFGKVAAKPRRISAVQGGSAEATESVLNPAA